MSALATESPVALTRRARRMYRALHERYPYAHCELDFADPLQLLVATILSAQSTDARVNLVSPAVFARYPAAADYAAADRTELETLIASTGFFRNKTDALIKLGAALVERFDAQVPGRIEDLVTLPGVGRKTANVVLGHAFGVPGLTVDTHFGRLVRRFGWTQLEDPVKVEHAIGALFPRRDWTVLSDALIFHGRRTCHAKKPACGACPVAAWCPSYGIGETDRERALTLLAYELRPGAVLPVPPPAPLPPARPRARPRQGLTVTTGMPSLAGLGETLSPRRAPAAPQTPPPWLDRMVLSAQHTDAAWFSRVETPEAGGRPSAVLLLFGPDATGEDCVLLIERAHEMRSHPGQVALPGGAAEPADLDACATALREAHEEVLLAPEGVEVLGVLPPLFIPPSGFLVTTVVGWWRDPSPVGVGDPAEVARVILAPLAYLVDPAHRFTVSHPSGYRGPGFALADDLLLWGFTGGIVDKVLDLAGLSVPWDHEHLEPLPDRFTRGRS